MRRFAVVVAAAALAVGISPVRAGEPLRSGSILAVAPDTSDVTWLWPWAGCNGAAACLGWTQTGCGDAMVGLDPAVMSSIELVSDLADGVTLRTLAFAGATPAGLASGRLVIEFWHGDCRQVPVSVAGYEITCAVVCEFRIPRDANWMTITSKPGNANIEWTLT